MGSSVINAIIILVAFKVIGCSRRALLWNRQAPIILDLVLSMCFFAACSGKASAQSHDASSTGFADYATELGEDPLLKLRDMTSARYSAKALPEMIENSTAISKSGPTTISFGITGRPPARSTGMPGTACSVIRAGTVKVLAM